MPKLRLPIAKAIENEDEEQISKEENKVQKLDTGVIANYFLGFWNARHASEAVEYIDLLENKSSLRRFQKEYGCWRPPPELVDVLQKPITKLPNLSSLPNDKDTRNLKFVLKILGCSLQENHPYKMFLKAQTHRQKRYWLHEYQRPVFQTRDHYQEPICSTRLKRLYHFFSDRFRQEDDGVYFNDKLLSYDGTKKVFYIGIQPGDNDDD